GSRNESRMSLANGIESLSRVVERVRHEGSAAVSGLLDDLRAVADSATAEAYEELARVCAAAADGIAGLANDEAAFAARSEAVLVHLSGLVDYACACMAAKSNGDECAEVPPPPTFLPTDPDDERQYCETVGMFVSHAMGCMQELEEEILGVESSQEPTEAVGGIRRVVHTLKAEFGVLNMQAPQQVCHLAESMIDACAEAGRPFPVDVMLEVADQLKQFLDKLARNVRAEFPPATLLLDKMRRITAGEVVAATSEATAVEGDGPVELAVGGEYADSLPEFVTEARSHLAEAEAAMLALGGDDGDLEQINLTFRAFHTIKGVAGFLNLLPLVELAHVAETLLDEARSGHLTLGQSEVDLVLASGDMIQQMLAALEGQPAPKRSQLAKLIASLKTASTPGAAAPVRESLPTAAAVAESAPTQRVAESADDQRADDAEDAPVADRAVLQPSPRAAEAAAEPRAAAKVERTVKVSTMRLDMLVDMVGELVIAQSMVLQDPAIQRLDNQSLARNIGQVGKITRDLQEAAMSLRMVTVKPTFQKMARLVRDVAGKSGKKVALTIQGEDTELDRNVVEQISDPLVHMIRNAVDHGIEKPDDRRAAGKSPEGYLLLRAYHQGGSIVIEIQDDGRGIDKNKVVQKAISKGLLPANVDVDAMSDQEAFGIIFLPGFSTAEKVTDLSGRGVGMDVVRRNIEALRGKIEIDSRVGNGTTFRMRLPLTLAIIDGMVVRVGRERYVVPTLSIEQSFRPDLGDVHMLVDRGECVAVRGAVLPIYRLKEIFAQTDGLDALDQGILIVVEIDGERSCLFVDEILGQQQVVIKSLGLQGDRVGGVSGGAIMSDGRIALILDVASLVQTAVGV
ncbi:MAG: hypothetical protein RL398_2613, partial [Planctomycetota bacterium]